MSDYDELLQSASQAMCEQRFRDADEILQRALAKVSEQYDKELILQALVHLYSHPYNEDFEKAASYMRQRESLDPSAATALSAAYFELYTRGDHDAAKRWGETAVFRAHEERGWSTLFSATALLGVVAATKGDSASISSSLRQIRDLLEKPGDINYDDAVVFLELTTKRKDHLAEEARGIAERIAGKIADDAFRARAEAITHTRTS